MAGTASAKTALDQMEGGDVFYDACMTADFLAKPVRNTSQSVRRAGKRIKKASQSDNRASEKIPPVRLDSVITKFY